MSIAELLEIIWRVIEAASGQAPRSELKNSYTKLREFGINDPYKVKVFAEVLNHELGHRISPGTTRWLLSEGGGEITIGDVLASIPHSYD